MVHSILWFLDEKVLFTQKKSLESGKLSFEIKST